MNRVVGRTLLVLGALLAATTTSLPPAGADSAPPAAPVSISRQDAEQEAQLVAAEDRRLQDLRTIATLARWQNRAQRAPYRVGTPAGYTLVLTPRSEPYVLADLLSLEPQTLQRMSDGGYLLSEHIVVLSGAELDLTSPGLTLRLASSPSGFASIVSMGGRLVVLGTASHPVRVMSWDPRLARPDTTTSDGRAYLRAIGGQVQLSYVDVRDLGFWSGRTGGLSLTGTDRPNTGSLDTQAAKAATGTSTIGGLRILPTGALPHGTQSGTDSSLYANTYVAARIDHTRVVGNAFGLFTSGADGVLVDQCTFLDSQITGVDFHRFVTGSTIQRTTSNHSGGDGFSLGRATQGVQISQSTASGNAGDGFVISGEPLANGPSAVGSPTITYGNNLLSNSTADDNGHYGIYIKDGFNMTVSGNHVSDSAMGIVATEGASNVSINGNQVSQIRSHGIALINGVTGSLITGNVVKGSPIYLRGSNAQVQGNTVLGADGHGISVVGSAAGTLVANNVTTGMGTSAIDTARAIGTIHVHGNSTAGWHDTTSLFVRYSHMMLHPMSLLWATILVLVLLSMIKGYRRRHVERGTDPYAHQSAHLLRAES